MKFFSGRTADTIEDAQKSRQKCSVVFEPIFKRCASKWVAYCRQFSNVAQFIRETLLIDRSMMPYRFDDFESSQIAFKLPGCLVHVHCKRHTFANGWLFRFPVDLVTGNVMPIVRDRMLGVQ